MSQDVLQFQCMACQASLTVPVHLAGVTGPCPKCGASVTSPPAPQAMAPAQEQLALPPMPAMSPPAFPQPMPPMEQQAVATIPQPYFNPPVQQPVAGGWGGPVAPPPQQPVTHLPPAQPQYGGNGTPEAAPPSTSLPPRRAPGLAPVGGSLMNQQGLGGFGPVPGGMSNPSPSPQWTLPGAAEPAPMPKREMEDPMTTILRGVGAEATSELDSDPRRLTAFDPKPASIPAPEGGQSVSSPPVQMPRPAMDVRLGGKQRGGGKKVIATLAALLIVGALGAAGWIYKEPIMEMVRSFSASPAVESVAGETTPPDAGKETVAGPESKPFDPLAKPSEGLAIQKPAPIILQNISPGTSAPSTAGVASSAPVPVLPAQTPVMEIKPAGTPDPISLPSVPAVPKATVVEELPSGVESSKAQHVPGTALGTKGEESKASSLVEVTPGKSRPIEPVPGTGPAAILSSEAATNVVVQATPESEKAAAALQAFFAARTLAERMPLTMGSEAEDMKSLMGRYYAKKDSGAIAVDEIKLLRYDPAPDTGGGPHCVFTVSSKLWEYPIPVMLQEEGGSYKVDWLAFVEFRDNLLFEFLSGYRDMPAKFHVGIRRTHYFEDDVPNLAELDCFEIQPPLPTYVGYVFLPKNTPLAADLGSRITWETLTAYVIVELRWKRLGEMKWVELTAVPQLNWYSSRQAAPAGSSAESKAPTEKKSSGGKEIKKQK